MKSIVALSPAIVENELNALKGGLLTPLTHSSRATSHISSPSFTQESNPILSSSNDNQLDFSDIRIDNLVVQKAKNYIQSDSITWKSMATLVYRQVYTYSIIVYSILFTILAYVIS